MSAAGERESVMAASPEAPPSSSPAMIGMQEYSMLTSFMTHNLNQKIQNRAPPAACHAGMWAATDCVTWGCGLQASPSTGMVWGPFFQ